MANLYPNQNYNTLGFPQQPQLQQLQFPAGTNVTGPGLKLLKTIAENMGGPAGQAQSAYNFYDQQSVPNALNFAAGTAPGGKLIGAGVGVIGGPFIRKLKDVFSKKSKAADTVRLEDVMLEKGNSILPQLAKGRKTPSLEAWKLVEDNLSEADKIAFMSDRGFPAGVKDYSDLQDKIKGLDVYANPEATMTYKPNPAQWAAMYKRGGDQEILQNYIRWGGDPKIQTSGAKVAYGDLLKKVESAQRKKKIDPSYRKLDTEAPKIDLEDYDTPHKYKVENITEYVPSLGDWNNIMRHSNKQEQLKFFMKFGFPEGVNSFHALKKKLGIN